MPNPIKGEVPLNLSDGRQFILVADHAALVKAAQAYSGSTKLQRLMRDMQPDLDAKGQPKLDEDGDPLKDTMPATAAFLYGLFDAYHPNIALRDATNMLIGDAEVVAAAIASAVEAGFPGAAEGKKAGNSQRPPRGKTSGDSGAKPA